MADEGQSVAGEDIVDDIVEFTGIEPETRDGGFARIGEVDNGHAPATRVGQIGAVPIEKEIVHAMPTLPDQLRQFHRGGGIRDIDDDEAEVRFAVLDPDDGQTVGDLDVECGTGRVDPGDLAQVGGSAISTT